MSFCLNSLVLHLTILVNEHMLQSHVLQESILVGCVSPACKSYKLQWPLPDVAPEGGDSPMNTFEQAPRDEHQMSLPGGVQV